MRNKPNKPIELEAFASARSFASIAVAARPFTVPSTGSINSFTPPSRPSLIRRQLIMIAQRQQVFVSTRYHFR